MLPGNQVPHHYSVDRLGVGVNTFEMLLVSISFFFFILSVDDYIKEDNCRVILLRTKINININDKYEEKQ